MRAFKYKTGEQFDSINKKSKIESFCLPLGPTLIITNFLSLYHEITDIYARKEVSYLFTRWPQIRVESNSTVSILTHKKEDIS
jgi:hypothetical protein